MKKISGVFIVFLLATSCMKLLPLRGNYPEPPFALKTNQSYDSIWGKIVDVFADRGIPIKIIDKSSGIIVSEKIKLSTTIEDKNGELKDKNAFIVPHYYDPGSRKNITSYPLDAYTGEFNVRAKTTENGSIVTINIVDVTAQKYMSAQMKNGSVLNFKSTGNLNNLFLT